MHKYQHKFGKSFLAAVTIFSATNMAAAHDLSAIHFERESYKKLLESRTLDGGTKGAPSISASAAASVPRLRSTLSSQQIKVINKVHDRNAALQMLTSASPELLISREKTLGPSPTERALSDFHAVIPKSVINLAKTWKTNSTLKVCFMEPEAVDAKRAIASYASEWEEWGSIQFDFGPVSNPRTCTAKDGSNIRITFRTDEYASYVGTDAEAYSQLDQATMFLSAFDTENYNTSTYRRIVLHEFGHALGFLHEHQHPSTDCEKQFDLQRIKEKYNWSDADIALNLSQLRASHAYLRTPGMVVGTDPKEGEIGFTNYDKDSIMHYSLDQALFKQPPGSCYLAQENENLSDLDKKGMAMIYPNISSAMQSNKHNAEIDRTLMTNKYLSTLQREAVKTLYRE
ncbi:MAG: hypothetical protein D4R39_01745 [Methylophilaceae bacterium]|nr:MAG: hypothetical protein D4R39_01745 [Methylophilaceae bacterium]